MQTEADYYALFEAYQRGELDADARAGLEARLSAEPRLRQLYTDYQELTDTLGGYAQRRRNRQLISSLHAAMRAADAPQAPAAVPAVVAPRLRVNQLERRLRTMWSRYRATAGVAASVAVLAVFGTLLGLEAWRTLRTPPMEVVQQLRLEVKQLGNKQKVLSSKISAATAAATPARPEQPDGKFSGTGFALTAEGYLVTSAHVVKGADSVLIEGHDHRRYHAETVYADQRHDLAILRIKDERFGGFGRLPYTLKAGQADLGERVYTLGFPREDVVYGEGALSARSGYRGDTAAYQISIPLNPGNSGGPLLDERGNLIGVVSGRQNDAQGAAFATKSSYLVRLVDSLRNRAGATTLPYRLPRVNQLAGASRAQQVKRLQEFVFVVKVYE